MISASFSFGFFHRLLLFTLGPFALLFVLALPSLWAKARRLPRKMLRRLGTLALNSAQFLLLVLYPVRVRTCVRALAVRASRSSEDGCARVE